MSSPAVALADPARPAAPPGWRAADPAGWHITLAFHGEAEPGIRARLLEEAARGAEAPRLRLAGAGAFHEVRWAGVQARPAARLTGLVEAAGGDPGSFVPHVTVLRRRGRRGRPTDPEPPTPWSRHRGPWWWASEVLLVSSEPARGGSRYRVIHRVPLAAP
jgi:2'-5' RNA ligase